MGAAAGKLEAAGGVTEGETLTELESGETLTELEFAGGGEKWSSGGIGQTLTELESASGKMTSREKVMVPLSERRTR
jgi:hypothetical protein